MASSRDSPRGPSACTASAAAGRPSSASRSRATRLSRCRRCATGCSPTAARRAETPPEHTS
eukprot:5417162-Prymnesium_polylepis.3